VSADEIDHVAAAKSRLTVQYYEATNFIATLSALATRIQNVEDALLLIAEQTDIDIAEGVNLDVIGDIVGVGRIVPSAYPLPFFGFFGHPLAEAYGEESDVTRGGPFRNELEAWLTDWYLDDAQFRQFIRAKIIKNQSVGTDEDILRALAAIFPDDVIIIRDVGGMAVGVNLTRDMTVTETVFLTNELIIPRPDGVRLYRVDLSTPKRYFGFNPNINAAYGEEADATRGGPLARERY
jgi:Protein of unknown function (DUF2612)